jgi:hypothetical protein
MFFPSSGKWLLRSSARDNRFVFGVYGATKVISYLAAFDRIFGCRPPRAAGTPSLRFPGCWGEEGSVEPRGLVVLDTVADASCRRSMLHSRRNALGEFGALTPADAVDDRQWITVGGLSS